MRPVKRIIPFIAAAGMIFLALLASPQQAAAQGGVAQLADALLRFEENVNWSAVEADWRGIREKWIASVRDASTPGAVAELMVRLETSMRWKAVEESWRRRRESWVREMQSAGSVADVARGLLELEEATRWSAVTGDWRKLRDAWVAGLKELT